MKKHQSFLARLFNRKNTSACADPAQPADSALVIVSVDGAGVPVDIRVIPDAPAPLPVEEEQPADEEPTICRNGKRYRARLRNGRWETVGGPIGDC